MTMEDNAFYNPTLWPEAKKKRSDCKFFHISELTDRTAANIVSIDLLADAYHNVIWQAARTLCQAGKGNCRYSSMRWNGATQWIGPGSMISYVSDGIIS